MIANKLRIGLKTQISNISLIMKDLNFLRHITYNSNQNTSNNNLIKNIIFNEKSHLVSSFKDYLIYDDNSEFLKKYYSMKESQQKIHKFSLNKTSIIPKYSCLCKYKIIIKGLKKKINLCEKERKNENQKSKNNFNTINIKIKDERIFTQRLIEEINKIKPLKFIENECKNSLFELKTLSPIMNDNKDKILEENKSKLKPEINFRIKYKNANINCGNSALNYIQNNFNTINFKEDIFQNKILNTNILTQNKNNHKMNKSLSNTYSQLKTISEKSKSIHAKININNIFSKVKFSPFINLEKKCKILSYTKNDKKDNLKKGRILENIFSKKKEYNIKTIEINDLKLNLSKNLKMNLVSPSKNINIKNNFDTKFMIKKLYNLNSTKDVNNSKNTLSKNNRVKKIIEKKNTTKFKTIVSTGANTMKNNHILIENNPTKKSLNNMKKDLSNKDQIKKSKNLFDIYHKLIKISKNKTINENKIDLKDKFDIKKQIVLKSNKNQFPNFINKKTEITKSPLLSFDLEQKSNFLSINCKSFLSQNNKINLNNSKIKSNKIFKCKKRDIYTIFKDNLNKINHKSKKDSKLEILKTHKNQNFPKLCKSVKLSTKINDEYISYSKSKIKDSKLNFLKIFDYSFFKIKNYHSHNYNMDKFK